MRITVLSAAASCLNLLAVPGIALAAQSDDEAAAAGVCGCGLMMVMLGIFLVAAIIGLVIFLIMRKKK